jgi:uncharacterized damage-inducible protein DinB
MDSLLLDLLGHQFWADIELWNAIGNHPQARDDKAIHDRLHHIHQVQRAFAWAVGDRAAQPSITRPADFGSFDALRTYARQSHAAARHLFESHTATRGSERIEIPWFRDPPLSLTVTEALTQMAMHSHHHRGQNATRLRELGGTPPGTDLIVWYWKGRPSATW